LSSAKAWWSLYPGTGEKKIENKVFPIVYVSRKLFPLNLYNRKKKKLEKGAFSILIDGGPLNHGTPETKCS
jgi:hypothetical protein